MRTRMPWLKSTIGMRRDWSGWKCCSCEPLQENVSENIFVGSLLLQRPSDECPDIFLFNFQCISLASVTQQKIQFFLGRRLKRIFQLRIPLKSNFQLGSHCENQFSTKKTFEKPFSSRKPFWKPFSKNDQKMIISQLMSSGRVVDQVSDFLMNKKALTFV